MEQYDWLRNGFLNGGGLHYSQDFSNEELQAWMKNDTASNMATLLSRETLWRSSFLDNLIPLDQKSLTSGESQLEAFLKLVFHIV